MGEGTRRRWRAVSAGVTLAVLSAGCGGYWPLRRPERDLWSAPPADAPAISLSARPVTDYAHQLTQDGLTIGVELASPEAARGLFHADLARHNIQPLFLAVQNAGGTSYLIRKSELGLPVIPAARVASLACPHPFRLAARYVKWLAFFLPGLVFEAVVEPTSTLDFPVMREASRHPAASGCRQIRQDFVAHELADGEVAPGQARAGVVFVRAVALGPPMTLALIEPATNRRLLLEFPTPPPVYARTHISSESSARAWEAVLKAVDRVASWRLRSADKARGFLAVRKGRRWLPGSSSASITLTVQEAGPGRVQVRAESPMRRPSSVHYGEHSRTIDRFFTELALALPPPPPPPKPTRRGPSASLPSSPTAAGLRTPPPPVP